MTAILLDSIVTILRIFETPSLEYFTWRLVTIDIVQEEMLKDVNGQTDERWTECDYDSSSWAFRLSWAKPHTAF